VSDDAAWEHPELSGNICWLLSQASYAVSARLAEGLQRVGLSSREHQVLTMARTGSYSQIQLARIVGLDKTTMVVTLDALEAAGFAERTPSADDRRARVITVTKKGERKLAAADEVLDEIREQVLTGLTRQERESLFAALRVIVAKRDPAAVPNVQPLRRRPPRPSGRGSRSASA
jgi:MarR family transcriptional regulator, transcriptional regulator for hemolysin